jgi:flagellar M-ring protein FliF
MADDDTPTSNTAQQLVSQLRGLWQKMPRLARLGGVAVIVVVLGAVLWTTFGTTTESWQAVARELPPEDASELSTLLAGRGIPQRIGAGGKSVEVPADRLAEARLAAASAGLPRGGVGFELFEGVSLGQSSFAEQVNYRRALQGELARSISALAPVEGARVHVALGKRSVFKDADEPPSASVVLRVRAGSRLSADQVRGVMQLVAASVDGLAADKVVVVDQHGDVLSGEQKSESTDQATIETTIGQRVRSILERVVGAGHVAVVVSATMDRRKVSTSEEIYDKDRAAIRSETHIGGLPAPAQNVGGIAGVQGNLPGAPAATGGAAPGTVGPGGTATTNYEITRTVRQTDDTGEKIGRLHLAILVDHKADAAGKLTPLPQAELDQLAQLARQAAGLDPARGDALEIRSFAFVPDDVTAPAPVVAAAALPLPVPVMIGGGAGVLVVGALALLFLLKRRGRNRKVARSTGANLALPAPLSEVERALSARDVFAPEALPPPPGASLQRSLEERVLGAVRADLPRTARVLAGWLAEPDPKPSKS